jgi:hypothetical protein
MLFRIGVKILQVGIVLKIFEYTRALKVVLPAPIQPSIVIKLYTVSFRKFERLNDRGKYPIIL